jgi:PhnB protein
MKDEATVVLSLTCRDSKAALVFYEEAFGAEELYRLAAPDGTMAHAEFLIGKTRILISDGAPDSFAVAMPAGSSSACSFSIMVENCDEAFERAKKARSLKGTGPRISHFGSHESLPAVAFTNPPQPIKEKQAIVPWFGDEFAAIATCHNVVEAPGILKAKQSRDS